jgi:hypothetical protein
MGSPEVAVEGEVVEAGPAAQARPDVAHGAWSWTRRLEGAPKLAALLAGEMEDVGAGGGWSWVLSDLKTLLETGKTLEG